MRHGRSRRHMAATELLVVSSGKRRFAGWQKGLYFVRHASLLAALVIAQAVCSASSASRSSSQEYQDYRDSRRQAYREFSDTQDQAYQDYRRRLEQEYQNFRGEITRKWGTFRVAGRHQWTDYYAGGNTKRSVNFQTGEIEVAILMPRDQSEEATAEIALAELTELLGDGLRPASEMDKRIAAVVPPPAPAAVAETPPTPTADPLARPALNTLVFGEQQPSRQELQEYAHQAMQGARKKREAAPDGARIVSFHLSLALQTMAAAKRIAPLVEAFSGEFFIVRPWIYAIIETESSFNPKAVSPAPAYGLMQIMPGSAGLDATRFLYGKAQHLAPEWLFVEMNNIRIGTAYMHVLYNRYLRNVKDTRSRIYCATLAYNYGIGNMARYFNKLAATGGRTIGAAVQHINSMDSEAVLDYIRNLDNREAREYLDKILTRTNKYADL